MLKKETRPGAGKQTRVLPNPKICRTRFLEIGTEVGECLVKTPKNCCYAMSFGEKYYICHHPNWQDFVRS